MFIQLDTHKTYRVAFRVKVGVSAVSIITESQNGAVRNFHSRDPLMLRDVTAHYVRL